MLGPFVAMGVVYIFAEMLVVPAIVFVIGGAVTPVVTAAVLPLSIAVGLLGLIAFGVSFGVAVKANDRRWMLDHFLAPAAGTFVALVLYWQVYDIAAWIIHLSNTLSSGGVNSGDTTTIGQLFGNTIKIIIGVILAIVLGLAGIAVVFSAPVIAIAAMMSQDATVRLASYLGFVVTGSYFGLIIVHFALNRPLPSG